jgi:hypothetical protein
MTALGWQDTWREVGYNQRRHRRQVAAVVFVTAVAITALSASLQWWALVDSAVRVTTADGLLASLATQSGARPFVVAGAAVCAVLAVTTTAGLAHSRRRAAERIVFERLGGTAALTARPALVEGALQGLAGGVLASVANAVMAPLLTKFERATLPSAYSYTLLRPHSKPHTAHFVIQVSLIREPVATVIAVALLAVPAGMLLGLIASCTGLYSRNPRSSNYLGRKDGRGMPWTEEDR